MSRPLLLYRQYNSALRDLKDVLKERHEMNKSELEGWLNHVAEKQDAIEVIKASLHELNRSVPALQDSKVSGGLRFYDLMKKALAQESDNEDSGGWWIHVSVGSDAATVFSLEEADKFITAPSTEGGPMINRHPVLSTQVPIDTSHSQHQMSASDVAREGVSSDDPVVRSTTSTRGRDDIDIISLPDCPKSVLSPSANRTSSNTPLLQSIALPPVPAGIATAATSAGCPASPSFVSLRDLDMVLDTLGEGAGSDSHDSSSMGLVPQIPSLHAIEPSSPSGPESLHPAVCDQPDQGPFFEFEPAQLYSDVLSFEGRCLLYVDRMRQIRYELEGVIEDSTLSLNASIKLVDAVAKKIQRMFERLRSHGYDMVMA